VSNFFVSRAACEQATLKVDGLNLGGVWCDEEFGLAFGLVADTRGFFLGRATTIGAVLQLLGAWSERRVSTTTRQGAEEWRGD
jgi:hypothetical protein